MARIVSAARLATTIGITLLWVAPASATTYPVLKEYVGPTFFDDWLFYDHYDDKTNGDTVFVSSSVASSAKLAYVDSASNHAIIKVDNTSTVPYLEKRNTVRIATKDEYKVGTVWVADFYHAPYGCSVWPAWSQASTWPVGGEIDIFEGVNLQPHNQMALHTTAGCTVVNPVQAQTSKQQSTNCDHNVNQNEGCVVIDQNDNSYGEAFAKAGGGLFVTEYAETGISIWFFSRANVPQAVTSNTKSIDTSTLGVPTAHYPATGCPMDQFFGPQNLILDITLCGDFAKPPQIYLQTCKGLCYEDNVVGNGTNYANAYFEIGSIRIYGASSTVSASGSASPTGASPGAAPTPTESQGSGAVSDFIGLGLVKKLGTVASLVLALAAW